MTFGKFPQKQNLKVSQRWCITYGTYRISTAFFNRMLLVLALTLSSTLYFSYADSNSDETDSSTDNAIVGLAPAPLSRPGDVVAAPSGARYHLLSPLSSWRSLSALELHAAAGPLLPGSATQQHFSVASGHEYYLERLLSTGANGQVFRAVRVDAEVTSWLGANSGPPNQRAFVVKRMYSMRPGAQQSGLREAYFGEKLARLQRGDLFARFVEHWFVSDTTRQSSDLWLAFRDEGVSLHQLLYDAPPSLAEQAEGVGAQRVSRNGDATPRASGIRLLQGSTFFQRLHQQPEAGARVFRRLLRQLLQALHRLHAMQVLHRDVKPGNLIISVDASEGLKLRLADFGSAVDFAAEQQQQRGTLYPGAGPSQAEETAAYAPPEVRLSAGVGPAEIPFDPQQPSSYDMFSAGIVALETLLGEPAGTLFTVPSRAQAVIAARHGGSLDGIEAQRELLLAGLRRFCILPPQSPGTAAGPAGADFSGCDVQPIAIDSVDAVRLSASFAAFRAALRRTLWRRHHEVLQRIASAEAAKAAKTAIVEASPDSAAGSVATLADVATQAAHLNQNDASAVALASAQSNGADAAPMALPGSLADGATSSALQVIQGGRQALDRLRLGHLLMPPDGADPARAIVPADSALLLAASDPAALALTLPSRMLLSSAGDVAALQLARAEDLQAMFDAAAAAAAAGANGAAANRALPTPARTLSDKNAQVAQSGDARSHASSAFMCAAASSDDGDSDPDDDHAPSQRDGASTEDSELMHDSKPSSSSRACPVDVPSPLLGVAGEELLFRLLAWDPHDRITAEAALQHPFFSDDAD